ncbi:hypothetical protein [Pseudomonas sp. IT-347P]|uniref:hypothetical protein n=1 Tax=Pseudomonas sp. IT-347P TaxID=3026458 RepID=UPI0039DFEE19
MSKVRFEPIDAKALGAFELWENPHFCWREIAEWKSREPLSLDIAIWFEEQLCGLCFVNPNKSRQRIRIVRLEEQFLFIKNSASNLILKAALSSQWRVKYGENCSSNDQRGREHA